MPGICDIRATSSQLKSERIAQSNTANTEIDDSLALQEFIKRMQSKTFLRVYKFVPIQDSTGQVVGNRLDEVMETGSSSGVEEETRNLVRDVQVSDSTSDRSIEEKVEQQATGRLMTRLSSRLRRNLRTQDWGYLNTYSYYQLLPSFFLLLKNGSLSFNFECLLFVDRLPSVCEDRRLFLCPFFSLCIHLSSLYDSI